MKKNLPLIVGISLPIFFIIAMFLAVVAPSFFIKPQHNFIYSLYSSDYYGSSKYENGFGVEDGRIVLIPFVAKVQENLNKIEMPPLYLYNVKENTTHLISFDEASDLILDPGPSSQDGYIAEYQYGGHDGVFEIFGSDGDRSGVYVSKGNSKKKLVGMADGKESGN